MSESIDLHSQKFEPHIPAAASLQPLSMLKSYRLSALNIEERMLERECFERRRQRKGPCHGVTRRVTRNKAAFPEIPEPLSRSR